MRKQLLLLTAASLFILAPAAQHQVLGLERTDSTVMVAKDKLITDEDLIASVKKVLASDAKFSKFKIDVKAENGIVTLGGKVDTVKDKIDIGSKVKSIDGVKDVVNNLEVGL